MPYVPIPARPGGTKVPGFGGGAEAVQARIDDPSKRWKLSPLVAVEPSAHLATVAARMRIEDADAVAVMSEARLGEDVRVVAVRMMALGIRHLPVVVDEGAPIGLLSARDLIRVLDPETGPS
ncbi:MAG: CBS domain-containing protein [Chloroflexi bacterium]|nr:MAG: CBS domain-containing protein [Chloroflexota bacterium]